MENHGSFKFIVDDWIAHCLHGAIYSYLLHSLATEFFMYQRGFLVKHHFCSTPVDLECLDSQQKTRLVGGWNSPQRKPRSHLGVADWGLVVPTWSVIPAISQWNNPMYGMYNPNLNHKRHWQIDVNGLNWIGIYIPIIFGVVITYMIDHD